MLAQIVRNLMSELQMTQPAFAQAIGASLDRVKNMASGRVSKLHPEEARMLVEEFGVRGDYLATGTGPAMQRDLRPPEAPQRSVQREVDVMEIPLSYKRPTRDIVAAVQLGDTYMLLAAIDDLVAAVENREVPTRVHESRRHSQSGRSKADE